MKAWYGITLDSEISRYTEFHEIQLRARIVFPQY